MRRLVFYIALVAACLAAGISPALADVIAPTIAGVDPGSAPNDVHCSVTVTGTDFTYDTTAGIGPSVFLVSSTTTQTLVDATFVDSATLSAIVPWGMRSGSYTLVVANPDGGSASLPNAFTVASGLGNWNAGSLYGGEIDQLLMKPGDSNVLYALAYGVIGLFRSDNAGEDWSFVSDDVWANNNRFMVDRYPGHENRLYTFAPNGLLISYDEGLTWTQPLVQDPWDPAKQLVTPQIFVSPDTSGTLFLSSAHGYGTPSDAPMGLAKSADGGSTWTTATPFDGLSVKDLAFDPTDSQRVALATSDCRVFLSRNGGDTWSEVASVTAPDLGLRGSIRFNPYRSGELWLSSNESGGGLFRSTDASITSWTKVSEPGGDSGPANFDFTDANSVYQPRWYSNDRGATWNPFGPHPWYGYGAILFSPDDTRTVYIADDQDGLKKSTDGGSTWQQKVEGLTGLKCTSLSVSRLDPLTVYATFNGPLGIYRSDDGAMHWRFLPISGSWNLRQVLGDPIDADRIYVGADSGFYTTSNGGTTWSGGPWNRPPGSPSALFVTMAADPDPTRAGHLLASFGGGSYGIGPGWLYGTENYGASWQAISLPDDLRETDSSQTLQWIPSIAFDPSAAGVVYLTTKGTGAYKSLDHGATWARVDDAAYPSMARAEHVTVATHPQHVAFLSDAWPSPYAYRSLDGGATWAQAAGAISPGSALFADDDSTRLFTNTLGLYFSSDLGDTWERAAGSLGELQVMALGSATVDQTHTVLYAATPGGTAASPSAFSRAGFRSFAAASPSNLVGPGVYRYSQMRKPVTLALSTRSALCAYASFSVTGTLKASGVGIAGREVVLQSELPGGSYKDTARVLTSGAAGGFRFNISPKTKTYYRVRFPGSFGYALAGPTSAVYALPRARLTRTTEWSRLVPGTTYTARGFIEPRHYGTDAPVRVLAYKRGSDGNYRYVTSFSAKYAYYSASKTRYGAAVTLRSRGHWRLVAYHAADSNNAAAKGSWDYVVVQ